MSFRDTKLYSIFRNKCPHCHQGDFFVTSNPYNLKKFDKMYDRCSHCGQSFEMETGFYYGAMYVSYALSVAIGVALFIALHVVFKLSLDLFMVVLIVSFIALIPVVFRASRLIWINFFVKYDPHDRSKLQKGAKPKISRI